MPRQLTEWEVEMADGTVHQVVADQRDQARWEVQPFAGEGRPFLRARFTAWSAMFRQQLTRISWERFDTECVEVRIPGDDGELDVEGEQGPNPGRPTTAATPSST